MAFLWLIKRGLSDIYIFWANYPIIQSKKPWIPEAILRDNYSKKLFSTHLEAFAQKRMAYVKTFQKTTTYSSTFLEASIPSSLPCHWVHLSVPICLFFFVDSFFLGGRILRGKIVSSLSTCSMRFSSPTVFAFFGSLQKQLTHPRNLTPKN